MTNEEYLSQGMRVLNVAVGIVDVKSNLQDQTFGKYCPCNKRGCEIWILNFEDIESDAFQRYAGLNSQRFPKKSPNHSAFLGLD